jgi:tetratricopeptide (TPR) repeat protein
MTPTAPGPQGDIVTRATAVRTLVELAELLRDLRRRQARERGAPPLTYEQIATMTTWSRGSVGSYLAGVALAPIERFDRLTLLLGGRPHEREILATARDRVADALRDQRPRRADAPPTWTLPAAPGAFTGRVELLSQLDRLVDRDGPDAVVITAVAGMGGVGKTALALQWGHSAVDRFPDGQLYVNLRGYDPGPPLSTMDALGVLLSGLRLGPAEIPTDEAARRARFRDLLRGRRVLVLLDNARSADQVLPLLPPAPGRALVTSRDDLKELVDGHHARRVRVDVFTEEEAVALLTRLLGTRADGEPAAVAALARRCGFLPLAVRVVADLAGLQPTVPLAALVDLLDAELVRAGLDAFDTTGDPYTDVRTVLSWSVRSLPAPAVRAYRLLGLQFGVDLDSAGFAALAGVSATEADALSAVLRRAHLVQAWPTARHTMHDLVRAHAREAAGHLEDAERVGAQVRLLDHYLTAAGTAVARRYPGTDPAAGRTPPAAAGPEIVDASAWLDVERGNLIAAVTRAVHLGLAEHATRLALVLWPYLNDRHPLDAHAVLADTAALGPDLIDAATLADLHNRLGAVTFKLGRLDEAADHARRALALRRDDEARRDDEVAGADGRRMSMTLLGAVFTAQGRPGEALTHLESALTIAEPGLPSEISAYFDLGEVHLFLERFEAARWNFTRAARAAQALNHPTFAARAQRGVAQALVGLGRHAEAADVAAGALAYFTAHGSTVLSEIAVRNALGSALCGLGRLEEALDVLAVALHLCEHSAGWRHVGVVNTLGETYRACGDHALARDSHRRAIRLAERSGDRWQRTRALVGLGDAYAALAEPERARECWREALIRLDEMGLPSAREVRDRLRR